MVAMADMAAMEVALEEDMVADSDLLMAFKALAIIIIISTAVVLESKHTT